MSLPRHSDIFTANELVNQKKMETEKKVNLNNKHLHQ